MVIRIRRNSRRRQQGCSKVPRSGAPAGPQRSTCNINGRALTFPGNQGSLPPCCVAPVGPRVACAVLNGRGVKTPPELVQIAGFLVPRMTPVQGCQGCARCPKERGKSSFTFGAAAPHARIVAFHRGVVILSRPVASLSQCARTRPAHARPQASSHEGGRAFALPPTRLMHACGVKGRGGAPPSASGVKLPTRKRSVRARTRRPL